MSRLPRDLTPDATPDAGTEISLGCLYSMLYTPTAHSSYTSYLRTRYLRYLAMVMWSIPTEQ